MRAVARRPLLALAPEPAKPTMSRDPMKLRRRIPWGEPDSALARMVCASLAETTPPILIEPNPRTNARIRRLLRLHHPA